MQGARLLLVEDDAAIATVIRVALAAEGADVACVATVLDRDRTLSAETFDAMITDVMLPDGNGLDGLATRVESGELPPVIVLSAQNTLDTAIRATKEGAFDYLPKPFDLDALLAAVRAAVRRRLPGAASEQGEFTESDLPIIGRDPAMQEVYRVIARVSETDLSVLVLGASGTGKELVAQSIHRSSRRKHGPFVAVNMAAIPRELIESELFGHEKGAFTGASSKSSGRFEQARGGTLFLDEIGDMPIEAQTRLLRVLQDGDFTPVGSARSSRADVRIIAATNQQLTDLVAAGRFREDLFYRLNVIPIQLPPLRERPSDISLLARHFLAEAVRAGLPAKRLTDAAACALTGKPWPGNVRELRNFMQRVILLTRGDTIDESDVALGFQQGGAAGNAIEDAASERGQANVAQFVANWMQTDSAKNAMQQGELYEAMMHPLEQALIEAALEHTDGNQVRAAALLGINRNTLRQKRQS